MHIGSGTDLQHLAEVCGAMEKVAEKAGRSITSINAGGGLPVPYKEDESYVDLDQYFNLWHETRQRLERRFGHPVRLEIEPGRYLVAESGFLITEIRAVKRMGGNLFYLLDAGFNNLARPNSLRRLSSHGDRSCGWLARRTAAGSHRGGTALRVGGHFHAA